MCSSSRKVRTFALLDDGSTITLIEERLAREIGVRGDRTSLTLKTMHGELNASACEKVNVTISGAFGDFEVRGAVTVRELPLPPQSISKGFLASLGGVISRGMVEPYYNARARVLIGQDNWRLLVTREIIEIRNPDVAISRTTLGWAVHGTTRRNTSQISEICGFVGEGETGGQAGRNRSTCSMASRGEDEIPLDQLMREYFEIDSLGVDYRMQSKTEHDRALEILRDTTRKVGKHWETGLLWKQGHSPGVNSFATARRRLELLERRLDRDPDYASLYYAEMQRFIDRGYAVKVTCTGKGSREWYLPHFGVTNVNKPGKVRLVFDAAAKSKGVSLNDQLEAGPDLLQSLPAVLIRFRQYRVAYKGDISDKFLRVRVRHEDRSAQRFLWRCRDRTGEPEIWEMIVLIFGARSSPCNAIYVKSQNAKQFVKKLPQAAQSIERNEYMDDHLGSSKDEASAITMVRDVVKINSQANFEMHSWASNVTAVSGATGEKTSGNAREAKLCDKGEERVLGLFWDVNTDELKFNLNFANIPTDIINGHRIPTKREVLRIIMSIFDPLGLLSPFTLRSKILMQEIWRSGIFWDTQLREEEHAAWLSWIAQLGDMRKCIVPRCLTPEYDQDATAQLHVFCDASLAAYAAAAYIRFEANDG